MRALAVLVLGLGVTGLVATSCYKPGFEDCVLTCGADNLCPDDLHCESGRCRVAGTTGACSPADAAMDPPDADPDQPDADPEAPDATPMIDATPPPDANCSGGTTCDLVSQSCCDDNQACDLGSGGDPTCRPVTGSLGQAAPCPTASACAAGNHCLSAEGDDVAAANTCHRFCNVDTDCAGNGGLCDVTADGSAAKMCSSDCEPMGVNLCTSEFACSLFNPTGARWHSDCRPIGGGKQGDPCALSQDCKKGLQCATDLGKCAKICIVGGTTPGQSCSGQLICVAFVPAAVVKGNTYGLCRTP